MRRLRLGLNGFATPAMRTLYADAPQSEWLELYARRFGCYEVTGTADPAWTADASRRLLAMAPPGLRLLPRHPGTRQHGWTEACRPLLHSPALGPVQLAWHGPWTPHRQAELENLLEDLWDALPSGGRTAVEFHDASWLRSEVMASLEMHETILAWSTRAGTVPFRRTAEALVLRITGHQNRRLGDEVAALLARLRQQPVDDREVFVVSTRSDQPYGLTALERFARGMGVAWAARPTSAHQADLADYVSA